MIKVQHFGFHPETGLSVNFSLEAGDDSLQFLTALGAFVAAYGAGRVVSIKADQNDAVQDVRQLAPAPRLQVENLQPIDQLVTPPVEETVVPPLAPKVGGSVQPAVTASAPASSPAPAQPAPTREAVKRVAAPKAAPVAAAPSVVAAPEPTPPPAPAVDTSGVEKVALDAVPAELKAAKSFRAALVYLIAQGHNTKETLVRACHTYGEVPVIARYLVPNPDPELSIDSRVERALTALQAEVSA